MSMYTEIREILERVYQYGIMVGEAGTPTSDELHPDEALLEIEHLIEKYEGEKDGDI